MSSDLKKSKSEKNARVFHITASVNSLQLECRKNVWHPHKVVIVWDKNDSKHRSKTIPWQPGAKNRFFGNLILPQADPVTYTCTTKLYKDPERKGTYKAHRLNFFLKNENKRGFLRVIATGSIDLAEHINKKSFKIFNSTVALKPATKNVVSGSVTFKMSSVMLQGGIPFRTREELVKDILQEAAEAAHAKEKAKNIPVKCNKVDGKKARRKLPLPSNPPIAAMDNSAPKELDIKDAKTSSEEKKNEEKMSQCSGDACEPVGAKGEKRTNEGKKSKEGSFVGKFCNVKQLASAAEAESATKEKAENVLKGQATSDVEKEEKEDDKILFSSAEDFKDSNEIKNSNLGQSVAVENSGREQSSSDSSECSVQTVIEVKVPRKREEEVKKCVITDEGGINSVPGGNNDKATATGTEEQPSKDAGAEKKEKEKLACFFDKLLKASPPKGDKIISSVRGPTKVSFPRDNTNKATAPVKNDLPTTHANAEEREKQRLASFFRKLMQKPVPHKVTRTMQCPQLSAYVAEEMNSLRNEIASVDKVLLKLEKEIQQTMDVEDCAEEYKGLTMDWMRLVEYRGELASRGNTLQILGKQEDFEQCCLILRDDLKVLLTLED
ncbi:PREDICTED: uncharacterized protein LOC107355701 [Acropora digitifera]|uniref:uncharacterized protein LOC107355701 n=1 Tax=Acropora digitifera TaxID=70779 RepID=UPI00077A7BE4|nr:PREDICTED: uncharacterized protein LOC107355701 [Acropora digitifera]